MPSGPSISCTACSRSRRCPKRAFRDANAAPPRAAFFYGIPNVENLVVAFL